MGGDKKEIKNESGYINYSLVFQRITGGQSLRSISKEFKIDIQNMRNRLKEIYGKEYEELIYGKIIAVNKNMDVRKIPSGQTNRCETNLTKEAKRLVLERYGGLEECGVWNDNYSTKYVIDTFNPNNNLGVEICWSSKASSDLIKRLKKYYLFCDKVLCVLVKDSNIRRRNRSYPILREKLIKLGFDVAILDISNPYTQ